MILSQTRRQMACFVNRFSEWRHTSQEHIRSSMPGPAAESPANGKRAMTPKAVSELYSLYAPFTFASVIFWSSHALTSSQLTDTCSLNATLDFQRLYPSMQGKDSQIRVRRCCIRRKMGGSSGHDISRSTSSCRDSMCVEFCALTDRVPWMAFVAEVLVCVFEIEFTCRETRSISKKRKNRPARGSAEGAASKGSHEDSSDANIEVDLKSPKKRRGR